jgi:LuxR family maltose regulon positive regulatory protein
MVKMNGLTKADHSRQSSCLLRSRLFEKLDRALGVKVTFICAPAGYGKTETVNSWLKHRGLSAIQVKGAELRDADDLFWLTVQEQLSKVKNDQQLFIFDDVHLIRSQAIFEKIGTFIRNISEGIHIILLSREKLPFSLSSLRLSGELTDIRTRDLCLTNEETAEWFKDLAGARLQGDDIKALGNWAEGWPVAVRLAALSFKPGGNISSLLESLTDNAELNGYFHYEVFLPQPENVQQFLLKTSILEQIHFSLCEAITGQANSQEMLEKLEKANLFVFTDSKREWWRYHPLFAQFLRSKAVRRLNNGILSLHRKASRWYRINGFYKEAIDHMLKAKEYGKAERMINQYAPDLFKRGEWRLCEQWLSAFPETRPGLAVVCGWTHAFAGRYDEATRCLAEVGGETDEYTVEKTVVEGYVAICQNDPHRAFVKFQTAKELSPGISLLFQKGLDLNLGEVQMLRGRLGMGGRLNHVEWLYPRLRNLWKHSGFGILAYGSVMMAEWLYERNRQEELKYFIIRGIELSERHENIGALVSIHLVYMRLKRVEGKMNEMWALFENIRKKAAETYTPARWLAVLRAFEIRETIRESRSAESEIDDWMAGCCLHDSDPSDFSREFEALTFARVLMFRRLYDQAMHVLNRWLDEARRAGRIASQIEMLILQAQILRKERNQHSAMQRIKDALILAEPEGYIRIFLDEENPVAELIASALRKENGVKSNPSLKTYAEKLLGLFETELGVMHWSKSNQALIEPLTQRELDVLQCMKEGLVNSAIAGRLGIKTGTVKRYIVSLYGKLGVENRVQAAAKAKKWGI